MCCVEYRYSSDGDGGAALTSASPFSVRVANKNALQYGSQRIRRVNIWHLMLNIKREDGASN
jgi:hypothetical protein